jgi:hypothetical protein
MFVDLYKLTTPLTNCAVRHLIPLTDLSARHRSLDTVVLEMATVMIEYTLERSSDSTPIHRFDIINAN